jgi:hypothetical protein
MVAVTERIGIILVHGIGEQRRFEHLEGQGRLLVDALRRRRGAEVTVDILSATGASYRSEQNTWGSSPSVRIGVKEAGQYQDIFLHEVWWADVNEPYSIAKQLRFWLWGLSVWMYPRKDSSTSSGFLAMTDPVIPGFGSCRKIIVRLELFAVSTLFLMAAFPLGLVVVLAKRLLNLSAPDFVQTMVNYVSAVKLYNQRRRYGSALFFNKESDFLDTMEEPPRVSVRRRMVEMITDMVTQKQPYERWYVLAHSLGSVVAFNGLMEPGESLANYLGKQRWEELRAKGFAGKRRGLPAGSPAYFDSKANVAPVQPQGQAPAQAPAQAQPLAIPSPPIPARPVWLDDDDIVYRHLLLHKFKGVLTYGSPLEKFAAIWPARVPVNKTEPHFPAASEWINIYDPVDPVSGVLKAFTPRGVPRRCVPRLVNIGFAAQWALLYAHLRYLSLANSGAKDLGDAIAHWVLQNRSFRVPVAPRNRWFAPGEAQHRRRWWQAGFQWIAVYLLIGLIGSYFVLKAAEKLVPKAVSSLASAAWDWLATIVGGAANFLADIVRGLRKLLSPVIPDWVANAWDWLANIFRGAANFLADIVGGLWMLLNPTIQDWMANTFWFIGACALITLAVGVFASLVVFKRDPDDARNEDAQKIDRKFRFKAAASEFGLICVPAQTSPTLCDRTISKINGLMRRLNGK